MATADERMRILKLVQDDKISPEDGVRLIEAMGQRKETDAPATLLLQFQDLGRTA